MGLIQKVGKYSQPQNVNFHTHSGYQLILVLSGTAEFIIGSSRYVVDKPSVVVVGNLKPHKITTLSEKYERYVVNLSARQTVGAVKNEKLLSIFFNSADGCVIPAETIKDELSLLFEMLLSETENEDIIVNSEAWILRTILLRLYRISPDSFVGDNPNTGETVRKIEKILHENLADDITLDSIARSLHMSKFYLSHCFSEQVGYSIVQYRLLIKTAAARELLASTEKSISEICDELGFCSMSNFSRHFKKETGFTPSEYRRRIKYERL